MKNLNKSFENQNETQETYKKLAELEIEIKKEIDEQESQQKKATFYKALDAIIDLKLNVEEVNQNFDRIAEVFLSMATGDFSKRLEVSNRKHLFSLLAMYLNKVNEELSGSVIRNHILEEALELTEDLVIITDLKGTIHFANSSALTILNRSKDNIIKLIIGNIFESQKQFGIENWNGECIENEKVSLIPYNSSPVPVLLSIKRLQGTDGPDSYLYKAKVV